MLISWTPELKLSIFLQLYGKSGEATQETFYEIVKHVLKKINKDKSESLFKKIDKNKNGYVTFGRFLFNFYHLILQFVLFSFFQTISITSHD